MFAIVLELELELLCRVALRLTSILRLSLCMCVSVFISQKQRPEHRKRLHHDDAHDQRAQVHAQARGRDGQHTVPGQHALGTERARRR